MLVIESNPSMNERIVGSHSREANCAYCKSQSSNRQEYSQREMSLKVSPKHEDPHGNAE